MDEFQAPTTSAKAWGVEAELLTPAGVKELVPFINDEVILGGFQPPVSVVDSLDAHAVPTRAIERAGCGCSPTPKCSTSRPRPSRPRRLQKVTAVVTDKGRIEAEYVVIGLASGRIAS